MSDYDLKKIHEFIEEIKKKGSCSAGKDLKMLANLFDEHIKSAWEENNNEKIENALIVKRKFRAVFGNRFTRHEMKTKIIKKPWRFSENRWKRDRDWSPENQ